MWWLRIWMYIHWQTIVKTSRTIYFHQQNLVYYIYYALSIYYYMFRFRPSPDIVHSLIYCPLLPDIDQCIYSLYCILWFFFVCLGVMLPYTHFVVKILILKPLKCIIKCYSVILKSFLCIKCVCFCFVDIDSFMSSFVFHCWLVCSSCCGVGCRLILSLWSSLFCYGILSGRKRSLELIVNVPLLDSNPKGRNI
jgi:hypothetical protein